MDTIKLDKKFNGLIAHRGLSGIETENTILAFTAAANRSYFGIECDVQVTKDQKYVISHDDSLQRLALFDIYIPSYTYDELLKFPYLDRKTGNINNKIVVPLLSEYLEICRIYNKQAVVELKGTLKLDDLKEIFTICENEKMPNNLVFISFNPEYLLEMRKISPKTPLYLLSDNYDERIYNFCITNRINLDINYQAINEDIIKAFHLVGLKINVYTVNYKEVAERLIKMGVDYITTNILE